MGRGLRRWLRRVIWRMSELASLLDGWRTGSRTGIGVLGMPIDLGYLVHCIG